MGNRYGRRAFLKTSAVALAGAPAAERLTGAVGKTLSASREWPYYGGDQEAARYSPLNQINRTNVARLRPAWAHHTEDAMQRPTTTIECTPIVVAGVMYVTTAQMQLRALDPATGEVLWNFDPFAGKRMRRSKGVNRGVALWSDGNQRRVFFPVQSDLWCINAADGVPVKSFGAAGRIDLAQNFDRDMQGLSFKHTSPPVVFEDLVIVGGGGGEGPYPAAPGHIRAYDVFTGKRKWIFHTIPHPGEFGHETWGGDSWKTAGGVNSWAGMSVDERLGWVFVSTGSPAFDFYGGDRLGQNLYSDCVLALDARTGERKWHFQTVHHDLWDYDLPCQPMLVGAERGGRRIDAVAQLTKTGLCFLFDRRTGQPLFDVVERPAPQSDVPGERSWPTQPIPVKPPPLSKHGFREEDLTGISPQAHAYVKEIFDQSRHGPIFTPPSLQGTIVRPGFLGGALWGGGSYDPETQRLFVNTSENSNLMTLVKAEGKPFPYEHKGYVRFFDHEDRPAAKPPWGHLTAIDLNTGEFVWREVLGEDPELVKRGIRKTGSLQMGGSIATAGKLVFVAATIDEKFRAFDAGTGETLWEHQLNAGGYATPCTYEANGKQYVVIAAGGGGKQRTKAGDEFVAFALG